MISSFALSAFCLLLLSLQLPATFILVTRLLRGARRQGPIQPKVASQAQWQAVSVIVPTLNEADRIEPCLTGLTQQGQEVREILVVDSHSTDGTPHKVTAAAQTDSRIRLLTDAPLQPGWVGRPWALHTGFLHSSPDSQWILGIDADTYPRSGLVASILHQAEAQHYDVLSLSPRFYLHYPGEWWLQPALLMTLIYRFDSAGVHKPQPDQVMANGQCFLIRRSVLCQLNGYSCAAHSFCDDVTLAQVAAQQGFKVGFLDGSDVISVRMYDGMGETWNGWGRSLDLKDAIPLGHRWQNLWLLTMTQGLPLLVLSFLGLGAWLVGGSSPVIEMAILLNAFLVFMRWTMQIAIAGSYHWTQPLLKTAPFFWLSPLADPAAVVRIALSTFQRSIEWRGRMYRKDGHQISAIDP